MSKRDVKIYKLEKKFPQMIKRFRIVLRLVLKENFLFNVLL